PALGRSKVPDWKKISGDLSRVLGVFRKINRDLKSEYWRAEWKLKAEDSRYLNQQAVGIKNSAQKLLSVRPRNHR
ncbi:MAG: hypothetical protein WCD79_18280, partial [Chthoniobacteraceae bacterium]